jgi:hypothetical protein
MGKGWEKKRSCIISRRRSSLAQDNEINPKESASAFDVQKEIEN